MRLRRPGRATIAIAAEVGGISQESARNLRVDEIEDINENLREEPKETRTAPLLAESRKVCRFEGSGRAGLRCSPPTFNGNQKQIGISNRE